VKTFFFYDLETSGLSPSEDRIMQFAGWRTDKDLNPMGNSINLLVKLNDDILPSPDAVMVTKITPQMTLQDGLSEVGLARFLSDEIFTPNTIIVGFNNVRFDDRFIQHLFWRNFFDPYEWQWKDGRSKWDILDLVRMTRALRPDGIKWPMDDNGKATNRLELITKLNDISHKKAHDALSDVAATIAVARLIKQHQPRLFDFLLKLRDKNEVKKLVNLDNPCEFVYTSGKYDEKFQKTTVAFPLTTGKNGNIVVYDLRHDPTDFLGKSLQELKDIFFTKYEARQQDDYIPLPVKELQFNRCPAIAPVSVLAKNWGIIGLGKEEVAKNKQLLLQNPDFAERIREVFEATPPYESAKTPETALYDSFLNDRDRQTCAAIRNAPEKTLSDFTPEFIDERLPELLIHFKARNFPNSLNANEAKKWQAYRIANITRQAPKYVARIQELLRNATLNQKFLLDELSLWLESISE
jgi:exodeoxyribonuclease-1